MKKYKEEKRKIKLMEISQIETYLNSENSQDRLKALTELRNYDSDIAVPLLLSKWQDPEFLVRSFVAMGLGKKRTPESYQTLLEMMKYDRDYNVRAEAANSVSKFGKESVSHLVEAFRIDDNWLLRRSILAAIIEMGYPDELWEICSCAIATIEPTVREAALDALGELAGTSKQAEALQQLLAFVSAESYRIRVVVARSLQKFDDPEAKAALSYLSKDENHRVVAAALESSL